VTVLFATPGLRGAIYLNYAIFCTSNNMAWTGGVQWIRLYDGATGTANYVGCLSRDGEAIPAGQFMGSLFAINNRLCLQYQPGIYIGNPTGDFGWVPHSVFVRLFDLGGADNLNTCRGGKAVPWNGGYLLGYGHTAAIAPAPIDQPNGLVLFVSSGIVKIVYVGGRVSAICPVGDRVLVATDTETNGNLRTCIDPGQRGITILTQDLLNKDSSPPCTFSKTGVGAGEVWGGFPLAGYRNPRIEMFAGVTNTLRVFEYNLGYPDPASPSYFDHQVFVGKNVFELDAGSNIVSLKFIGADANAKVVVHLS
jgi:hypothetical protein